MKLTLLHTNDFHGTLTREAALAIRDLKARREPALYFDSGDCIRAGNLAIPLGKEPAWEMLDAAGCDASVLGNRETHLLEPAFRAKIAGARHPVLCENLRTRSGERPLPGTLEIEKAGVRVGVVGVMVAIVTARMAARMASAYLWEPPLEAAARAAELLRPRVDLLIALTHLGAGGDVKLAQTCALFDVILGGHSHTVLSEPLREGSTAVCQAGSHGRHVGVWEWEEGRGVTGGGLVRLR